MRITRSATTNDKIALRRQTMSNISINDLADTTEIDQPAMASIRGGWFSVTFDQAALGAAAEVTDTSSRGGRADFHNLSVTKTIDTSTPSL
jgi:DNA mismatch repair protein MutH